MKILLTFKFLLNKGARVVTVIVRNELVDQRLKSWIKLFAFPIVLILLESYKSINSLSRLCSLNLPWQPVKEKENFEFEPVILSLKADLVLDTAYAEGLDIYIHSFKMITRYIGWHFCRCLFIKYTDGK